MTPKDLIKHFGSDKEAAHALGKTVPCIRQWLAAKHIPHWSQLAIQTITENRLKADSK